MFNRNGGHGITGSKNVYSTSAHIGNWREDVIGQELMQDALARTNQMDLKKNTGSFGASLRNRKNSYSTSSQVIGAPHHLDDVITGHNADENTSEMKFRRSQQAAVNGGQNQRFLTQEELKAKNKEGLNYALLFSHTNTGHDISVRDRYTSMNKLSSSHYLFQNDNHFTQNGAQGNVNSDGMQVTFNKRVNTIRNSNNIKDIYRISEDMLPPVSSSYSQTKNREAAKDLELGFARTTSAGSASRLLTSQYAPGPGHSSAPLSSFGRTEPLPSAKRYRKNSDSLFFYILCCMFHPSHRLTINQFYFLCFQNLCFRLIGMTSS